MPDQMKPRKITKPPTRRRKPELAMSLPSLPLTVNNTSTTGLAQVKIGASNPVPVAPGQSHTFTVTDGTVVVVNITPVEGLAGGHGEE